MCVCVNVETRVQVRGGRLIKAVFFFHLLYCSKRLIVRLEGGVEIDISDLFDLVWVRV